MNLHSIARARVYAVGALSIFALAACGNPKEPARHSLDAVQSAVAAVAPQAQKYVPEQFASLQAKESELQASFDKGDFKQVLADAPTLLNSAQALGAAATAKKDQIVKTMSAQWTGLAQLIPDSLSAVQARIDSLPKNKKPPAGVDPAAAKAGVADATALWTRAQEALSSADVETAVDSARKAQAKIQAAASALKFSLPTPQ